MRTRSAAAWVAFVLLLMAVAFAAERAVGQAPAQSRISVTATLEAVDVSPGGRVHQYLLWNTAVTPRPLGHAFVACQLGPGSARVCTAVYTLPLGRLAAVAETHSLNRIFGIVTGGSRSARAAREGRQGYDGAEGTLRQLRVGPGTYTVTFVLGR